LLEEVARPLGATGRLERPASKLIANQN
jgi:hypothetical protein